MSSEIARYFTSKLFSIEKANDFPMRKVQPEMQKSHLIAYVGFYMMFGNTSSIQNFLSKMARVNGNCDFFMF